MGEHAHDQENASRVRAFLRQNSHFDLLHFDLHNRAQLEKLNWDKLARAQVIQDLKDRQRLLWLHPDQQASSQPSQAAFEAAEKLIQAGFTSAQSIILLPEEEFVARYQRVSQGDDRSIPHQMYQRAVHIAAQAQHLWGRIKDTVADPYYRATHFANGNSEVINYYEDMPSYQDLFGTLDYCTCEHCRSILSPAAYFVDLMRIIDECITNINHATIPPGFTLQDRCPLLFTLPLSCENTNMLIPSLQLVNESLEALLKREGHADDAIKLLAGAKYPFNLPFNQQLQAIRNYFEKLATTLFDVYQKFSVDSDDSPYAQARDVWREYLKLSVTGYTYLIGNAQSGSPAEVSPFYGYLAPDSVSRHLPLKGQGTLMIQKGSRAVTGLGTNFQQQLLPGDQILLENAPDDQNKERTVVEIDALKQSLQVAEEWTTDATDLRFVVKPQQALNHVQYFLGRTLLNYNQLGALFLQQLSPDELKSGVANTFFINRTGQELPYLHIQLDTLDPSSVQEEIVGLLDINTPDNLSRLDHINRFVRLAATLGWSYADLDWAMVSLQANEITGELLEQLGKIQYLYTTTGLPVDILCSFWHDMKYRGRVDDARPQDLFDRVFNNPALLAGKNPYIDSHVPFNPTVALTWDIVDRVSTANTAIRSRLLAALGVNDDDLTKIALYTLKLLGHSGTQIQLSLTNLTHLYRLARIPAILKIKIDEYLVLRCLLYYPEQCGNNPEDTSCYLNPLPGMEHADIDALIQQIQAAAWIKNSPFTFYELLYILTGAEISYTDPNYIEAAVDPFIRRLAVNATNARVNRSSFLYESINATTSSALFEQLVTDQTITPIGILNTQSITYDGIAPLFKICWKALITNDIPDPEVKEAFLLLREHGLLLETILLDCDLAGILSSKFTEATSLDFLFENDPKAQLKRGQVKAILLQIRLNILNTRQVLLDKNQMQKDFAINGLSDFLKMPTETIIALFPFVTSLTDPGMYLKDLLTPDQSPSPAVENLIRVLSRGCILVKKLGFTPDQILAVVAGPEHFNISSPSALTLADIQSLSTFIQLVQAFHDTNNTLICCYFQITSSSLKITCNQVRPSTPISALAALTGWDSEQIEKLLNIFYPLESARSTVAALQRLKQAFDLGRLVGADIYVLLQLSALSKMDDTAKWDTFSQLAQAVLALVSGKYGEEQFAQVSQTIRRELNLARRDHLLWFTIWYVQKPYIQQPSDLYQYLLIDVETGDCEQTSPIAQGIASVQLYLQRCRMMLEPGVTDLGRIHPPWWEWMMNYRVWEANRKIFLYPENYLDPSVRPERSPLFRTLQDDLSQTNLDRQSITDAFMHYFESLEVLSGLKYVESYNTRTFPDDPAGGDTTYIFGRTPTQPYAYYYRTYLVDYNKWSPWYAMELSINTPYISSVYAFNKVMVFWSEAQTTTSSTIAGGTSNVQTTYQAVDKVSVKFSYLKHNHQWLQPQTLLDNFVVNFSPDPYLQDYSFITQRLKKNTLYWQTLYPLHILPTNYIDNSLPKQELILINYGFALDFQKGQAIIISPPEPTENPDENSLNTQVYTYISRLNQFLISTPPFLKGYVLYNDNSFSNNLIVVPDKVALLNYLPPSPQPYAPLIAVATGTTVLGIARTNNVLYDNYYANSLVAQQPASSTPDLFLLYNLPAASNLTMVKNQPGWFLFDSGNDAFLVMSLEKGLKKISEDLLTVSANQPPLPAREVYLRALDYTDQPQTLGSFNFAFKRLTTATVEALNARLVIGGIDELLTLRSQQLPELPFSRFYKDGVKPPNTNPPATETLDFDGAYGLYFRELFFHAPYLIAKTLSTQRQFEEARKWYQYIFDPTHPPEPEDLHPQDRYWRYLPFRSLQPDSLICDLTSPAQIKAYNDDPFNPFAIADLRPTAYQKAIVMEYINNLLEWGDFLFTQDTRESITQATNLYVIAADLLGPRPRSIGECAPTAPVSFQDIKDHYPDGIPQFIIDLENVVVSHDCLENGGVTFTSVPINYLPGIYFCIPENQEFLKYWDLVEDRLYKIRHCMNIQGTTRSLALFAPPIEPGQLMRAAASGTLNLPVSVRASIPLYRFSFLLAKAKEITGNLKDLGSTLLSTLEKRDAEALAVLLNNQESNQLTLITAMKEGQVNQLLRTRDALQASLNSAEYRYTYYTTLLKEGLSPSEILSIQSTILANVYNLLGGTMKTLASVGYLIPNVGSPFAITYGGREIGASLDAVGSFFDLYGTYYNFIAGLSQTSAIYERRSQDWELQAQLADYDRTQIQAQVEATDIQLTIAERDYAVHMQAIAANQEVGNFYRSKFTNQELYQWMASTLSTLYFQTYSLALEMAMAAQSAYQYEMNSSTTFIHFGYWDDLRKGLLTGERLLLSLNQMDKFYTETNVRKMEIQKTISLLRLDPKALLDLKQTGECIFQLSEKLFDYDFPGHYARKIKTISISIPALVGPYENIKATLTQLSNQIIQQVSDSAAALNAVNFLLNGGDANEVPAGVLRSNWWVNQQIALSTGMDDAGLFEINFQDDQYLPFEGTGAVSTWRLSMPLPTNRIDFSSISDVIIQLKYTALDGGTAFRQGVVNLPALLPFTGSQLLSFKDQYSQNWYTFLHTQPEAEAQRLIFTLPPTIIPPHLKPGAKLTSIYFKLLVPEGVSGVSGKNYITFQVQGANPISFDLTPANDQTVKTSLDLAQLVGQQEIIFNLQAGYTPDSLRVQPLGALNPTIVHNIALILFYEGEVNWSQIH